MTLTVYHLKNCDKCRKAIKALQAAGKTPVLVDVRADGTPQETLEAFEAALGWETLLNTRSATWRGLSDSDKADINAAKALSLMAAHPTLIKRPVITNGDHTTVGWKAAQQALWL